MHATIIALFALFATAMAVPAQKVGGVCRRTGCSGEVCANQTMYTTCIYRPEYACYANATCTSVKGQCGWVQTPELTQCIKDNQGGAVAV
ncbi:hypothetical protein HDV00_012069 [Rhizophlyctis rosea]|nr:hypothetical protein HDV00_012069 [Rhizophlyctis rosea]